MTNNSRLQVSKSKILTITDFFTQCHPITKEKCVHINLACWFSHVAWLERRKSSKNKFDAKSKVLLCIVLHVLKLCVYTCIRYQLANKSERQTKYTKSFLITQ